MRARSLTAPEVGQSWGAFSHDPRDANRFPVLESPSIWRRRATIARKRRGAGPVVPEGVHFSPSISTSLRKTISQNTDDAILLYVVLQLT
jgi:hypothetical protein